MNFKENALPPDLSSDEEVAPTSPRKTSSASTNKGSPSTSSTNDRVGASKSTNQDDQPSTSATSPSKDKTECKQQEKLLYQPFVSLLRFFLV